MAYYHRHFSDRQCRNSAAACQEVIGLMPTSEYVQVGFEFRSRGGDACLFPFPLSRKIELDSAERL
jgi:hypothetical protein